MALWHSSCEKPAAFRSCVLRHTAISLPLITFNNYTQQQKKCQKWLLLNSLKIKYVGIQNLYTLKCLSIGTPKAINVPFVSNEKVMFFRCPNIGTPKNNEFSIWNKWKIYYF